MIFNINQDCHYKNGKYDIPYIRKVLKEFNCYDYCNNNSCPNMVNDMANCQKILTDYEIARDNVKYEDSIITNCAKTIGTKFC